MSTDTLAQTPVLTTTSMLLDHYRSALSADNRARRSFVRPETKEHAARDLSAAREAIDVHGITAAPNAHAYVDIAQAIDDYRDHVVRALDTGSDTRGVPLFAEDLSRSRVIHLLEAA